MKIKQLREDSFVAHVLGKIARAVLRHPRWFVLPQIVLFGLSVFYTVTNLQFDTSRSNLVGKNKELYLAALKNTIPMFSETGRMDPKGEDAVLAVFSVGSPEVANAKIDVSKTFTNKFIDQAKKTTGSVK